MDQYTIGINPNIFFDEGGLGCSDRMVVEVDIASSSG
jgi:hypothetical protein